MKQLNKSLIKGLATYSLIALPFLAPGTAAAALTAAPPATLTVNATVLDKCTIAVPASLTFATSYDAHEASIFTVTPLSGSTYFLVFHPRVDIFSSVRIEGLESQVVLGPDGGEVIQSGLSSRRAKERSRTHLTVFEYELSYRFMIKPGIQPGTYDWPLQLTIRV